MMIIFLAEVSIVADEALVEAGEEFAEDAVECVAGEEDEEEDRHNVEEDWEDRAEDVEDEVDVVQVVVAAVDVDADEDAVGKEKMRAILCLGMNKLMIEEWMVCQPSR